jgi:diacylglycerol kinase (ATP)
VKNNKELFNKNKKGYTPGNWISTLNVAIEGLILATKTERNMKLHFLIALIAIFIALFLHLSVIKFLLIFISAIFVLFAELFNTSIEYLVDFISEDYSVKSAAIKNISAGAVLVSSFGAFIVGYEIFSKYIYSMVYYVLNMIRSNESDIIIVVISIVFAVIIVIKALTSNVLTGKATPLQGGMPSGHAAIAFAIWLMVSLLTFNPVVSALTFILAFIIAASRLYNGIHSRLEVLIGSLIGIIITALIFKLFYF